MANQARKTALVWCVLVTVAAGAAHAGGHGRCEHHAGCRNGQCVPHCPVRPGQFGYHGTHWRRWPGTGVVPVSAISDAVPVRPPRSAVPGADEESPRRTDDEPESKADDSTPEPLDGPVFRLPAAGADDGAQVPLPIDLRSVEDPRQVPPAANPRAAAARSVAGESRNWRQFVDAGVTPTSSDETAVTRGAAEEAADDPATADNPAAADNSAATSPPTRVAPVAFYPPRPPAQPAGRPQRAAVPARGR